MKCATMLVGCAIAAATLVTPAAAETTAVNVALMDMSAVASGSMGQGSGLMGSGTGLGMMSPGMTRRGGGQGMMGMMSIRADKTSAKTGALTFNVTNWSRGVVHEMLVLAVDSPDAPLPYDFSKQIIPEDQVKALGETNELQPNGSKSIEPTLASGNYLVAPSASECECCALSTRWLRNWLPAGYKTNWYGSAWGDFQLNQVLLVTFQVAFRVVAISAIIGVTAAYAMATRFPGQAVCHASLPAAASDAADHFRHSACDRALPNRARRHLLGRGARQPGPLFPSSFSS